MSETMTSDSLRGKALRGAAWIFFKQAYVNVTTLGSMVLLARLIAPSNFGLIALASVFVSILLLLADLGMSPSLVRIKQPTRLQLNTAFWTGLCISLALALGLVVLSFPISWWLHQPELRKVLPVLSVMLPMTALNLVPIATLTREMRFRPLALREVAAVTASTAGAIPIALAGGGVWALVFQSVGGVAVESFVLWRTTSWRPNWEFSRAESRALLSFGMPAMLARATGVIRDNGTELIIGSMLGTAPLGYYVVASRISAAAMNLFTNIVATISLPAFAAVQHDAARLVNVYRHALRSCGTLTIPTMTGLAVVSPTLIPLVFGQSWDPATPIAQVVAITAVIVVVGWVDSNVWWALGRPKVELYLTMFITVLHIAFAFTGAQFGALGVAVALLVRVLITVPIRMLFIVRMAHFPLRVYADMPGQIATSAIMFGVVSLARDFTMDLPLGVALLAEVCTGVAIYLLASLVLQRANLSETLADVRSLVPRRATTG